MAKIVRIKVVPISPSITLVYAVDDEGRLWRRKDHLDMPPEPWQLLEPPPEPPGPEPRGVPVGVDERPSPWRV